MKRLERGGRNREILARARARAAAVPAWIYGCVSEKGCGLVEPRECGYDNAPATVLREETPKLDAPTDLLLLLLLFLLPLSLPRRGRLPCIARRVDPQHPPPSRRTLAAANRPRGIQNSLPPLTSWPNTPSLSPSLVFPRLDLKTRIPITVRDARSAVLTDTDVVPSYQFYRRW